MDRIEEIKRRYAEEISKARSEQANCNHVWNDVEYDPEIIQVPRYETSWQGVDCWPSIVGFIEKKEDRWSRTCKKCGKVEYTKEQVAVKYEPKFS